MSCGRPTARHQPRPVAAGASATAALVRRLDPDGLAMLHPHEGARKLSSLHFIMPALAAILNWRQHQESQARLGARDLLEHWMTRCRVHD